MRYVRVKGHYPYQHRVEGAMIEASNGSRFRLPDTDQLEVIEPGSVVGMEDDLAKSFVARGRGEFCEGPERLIRPPSSPEVERPGLDPRHARAERAVAPAQQRAGAI